MTTHQATVVSIRRSRPAAASVQGALALDMTPRLDLPPVEEVDSHGHDIISVTTLDRPGLDTFVRRYLASVAEIAIGDRPVAQVLRFSANDVYAELSRRAQVVSAAAGTSLSAGRGRGTIRPALVSARTSLIDEITLEAAAHLRYGNRSRALAARFEFRQGRWQCTALQWS